MSSAPVDLQPLSDFDSPDVVAPAFRRFRRGLVAALVIVAGLSLVGGFLAGRPRAQTPRELLARAPGPHFVGETVRQGRLSALVLETARVGPETYAVHFVASADSLTPSEALHVEVPLNTLIPAPGDEDGLGGARLQTGGELVDSGFGPGTHVVEAWVLVPAGTRRLPVQFISAVPVVPGGNPPGGGRRPTAPENGPPETGPAESHLPPSVPGTDRALGNITIDMETLDVPARIWRR